jgi:hypothetical protein
MSRRVPLVAAARLIGSTSSVDHRKDCPRAAISSGKWESHSRHPVIPSERNLHPFVSIRLPCPPRRGRARRWAASYRPTTAWPTKGKEQHCGSPAPWKKARNYVFLCRIQHWLENRLEHVTAIAAITERCHRGRYSKRNRACVRYKTTHLNPSDYPP